MSTSVVRGPSGRAAGFAYGPAPPPWLSFSGRWPCVRTPGTSTRVRNGSAPPTGRFVIATGMIAIDSYHDAREVSYVPCTLRTSPRFTRTRQLAGVAVIATSHDTGPA